MKYSDIMEKSETRARQLKKLEREREKGKLMYECQRQHVLIHTHATLSPGANAHNTHHRIGGRNWGCKPVTVGAWSADNVEFVRDLSSRLINGLGIL